MSVNVAEVFGQDVFNEAVMKERLPEVTYKQMVKLMEEGGDVKGSYITNKIIPLPGTGAWTGSLLAALLGMKFKKAFPAVVLGIFLASFIMSVVSYGLLGAILH